MSLKGFRISHTGLIPLLAAEESLDEFTRGLPQGFYTTFITNSGGMKVLGLKGHLDRLYLPAGMAGIRPSIDRVGLCKLLASLIQVNSPNDSRIRLILARRIGEIFVGLQPFRALGASVYANGVRVRTIEMARHDPCIKGTDFITESAAQRNLLSRDIFEILMTHKNRMLEGLTSNFFAIKGSALITARQGVLLGVTRKAVLKLARGQGMQIAYRAPAVHEKFNEAFLTSSSRGVVPIVSIDGHPVGEGRVGVWTKRLSQVYQAYVEEGSESLT